MCWWASLSAADIQQLAFVLSRNAIRVWNNYHFPEETASHLEAVKNLPVTALEFINGAIAKTSDMLHEKKLDHFFKLFITPVIQFQDGEIKIPYEVKSAFLSVFYILKGMLSVRNKFVAVQCFSSSITRSLDAIKISNILTSNEISMLTQKYLLLSNKHS